MNDISSREVSFEGDIAIANLNDIDLTKTVGAEDNPLYQLVITKLDNRINVKLINRINKRRLASIEIYKLEEIGKALTNKRNDIVYMIYHILSTIESEDVTKRRLIKIATAIQQHFNDPDDPDNLRPELTEIKISDEERDEAIEFLKKPDNLSLIKKELDRTYIGQDEAKMYLYLKGLQAYTPVYAQVSGVAGSSVGKTKGLNSVVDVFPDEHVYRLAEFSPTALRYAQKEGLLEGVRLLTLGQSEGGKNKYHILMLSRDDKEYAECWITNRETRKIERLFLPKLSMWNTSVNFYLSSEQSTRTDRIFFDESIEQNKRAGKFIADRWRVDNALKVALGELEPSIRSTIRNAIRIYSEEIYETLVPFSKYVENCMDSQKQRYKRDMDSFFGMIYALANWRKYNRKFLIQGEEVRILAEWKDFEDAIKYGEVHISQTYFNVPNKLRPTLEILRSFDNWASGGYVYIKDIEEKAEEHGISRSTLHEHLLELVNEVGCVDRRTSDLLEQDEAGKDVKIKGYYYRSLYNISDSIFVSNPEKALIQEEIEKFEAEMRERGVQIMTYDELKLLQYQSDVDVPDHPDRPSQLESLL